MTIRDEYWIPVSRARCKSQRTREGWPVAHANANAPAVVDVPIVLSSVAVVVPYVSRSKITARCGISRERIAEYGYGRTLGTTVDTRIRPARQVGVVLLGLWDRDRYVWAVVPRFVPRTRREN